MNIAAKEWSPSSFNTTTTTTTSSSSGTFSKQNIDETIKKFENISIDKNEKQKKENKKKQSGKENRIHGKKKQNRNSQNPKPKNNNNKNHRSQQQQQQQNQPKNKNKNNHKSKHKKNTESFDPDYSAPDCRIVIGLPTEKFNREYSVHDIVMVPQLVCDQGDFSLYEQLVEEIQSIGRDNLLVEWHGDTHLIANDKIMGGKWKEKMPAFKYIVDRMQSYFDMDIKATRFNWYRNSKDWKPYHHDAAAVKARFALTQNCTVAVSVGQERECGFQHAKTGTVVSCPQPNGCAYAFGRDVNLEWRHGVLPTKKEDCTGRISIIAWGYVEQSDDRTRQANHPFFNQDQKNHDRNNNNNKNKHTFKKSNNGNNKKGNKKGKGWFSK